jgi:hypothetical protein
MDPVWREHLEALKRFNAWEDEQLRNKAPDYAGALAWLAEAWELATQIGSPVDAQARRERHLQEIVALRASLARANLSA